jgi:hypothetical protein
MSLTAKLKESMKIIDIGAVRANKYVAKQYRIGELKLMIHCCDVAYNALIHIKCPKRVQLTNTLDNFSKMFVKELEVLIR